MTINLLYFDDCPSWKTALTNLQFALKKEHLDYSINPIRIETDQQMVTTKFLGSPSFQIDGKDFWPENRTTYSMNCRVYNTPTGLKGWPTVEMLRKKLIDIRKDKEIAK
ncbi:thioredoxin family protein [bacterium]|nr:thioredoxin family protein [bacterium]